MSGVQPFQFKPTYSPGEELVESEEENGGEESSNFNAESGTPNGVFVVETVQQCSRQMNAFAAKNWTH